jgi:proto-oncogene serine/threonine-protein kinase mos
MVGTSGYQAPEFLRGGIPSTACDIYSLGIMFWQLDSRQIPFQGVHPHTVIFGVVSAGTRPQPVHTAYVGQAEFSALYRHCWEQEASLRPSAAAVGVQLGQIIRKVTRTNARKDQLRI